MPKSVFSDAHKAVVEVLVTARKASGLRQADLASRLGKDQSYISNIERGQRRVDVLEFYALARAMRCDPAALYASLASQLPDKVEI